MNKFAENLKKARSGKNISQDELAKKIGVHATHVSRYERGLSAPSIDVVQKIAETLDVSIDELVFGNQSIQLEQKIKDRELLSLFSKVQILNEKQKETVKDVISAFILKADLQQKLVS
jgi:transcriptional regulator with XRE-family HTH domain